MCNKDDLVSYLYDDLDGPARAAFEGHLRACAGCRDELTAMRSVRTDLLTWSPPEPDFAFRLVAEPRLEQAARVLRPAVPSWRAWFTPAAGFAAAAVLVLAAAASVARVEVRKDADGFSVRTGWSATEIGVPQAANFGGTRARDIRLEAPQANLNALERRISALETATRDTAAIRNAATLSARSSDDELLEVVRDLLAQSETRQKGELAVRLAQVIRDVDMKRAADINGVRQGLGRIDANMTEEAAAHREMMNYILTSSKQQK